MCSLYYLDSYKRDNILLNVYKGSPEGDLQISCALPVEQVMRMPEKFTVEQKEQIVIESFHNSLKTGYIWINDLETFENSEKLIEHAFNDYKTIRHIQPYHSLS